MMPLYRLCESRKLIYSPKDGISSQGRDTPLATWAYIWPPHGSCLVGADLKVAQHQAALETCVPESQGPHSLGNGRKQQRPGQETHMGYVRWGRRGLPICLSHWVALSWTPKHQAHPCGCSRLRCTAPLCRALCLRRRIQAPRHTLRKVPPGVPRPFSSQ